MLASGRASNWLQLHLGDGHWQGFNLPQLQHLCQASVLVLYTQSVIHTYRRACNAYFAGALRAEHHPRL